MLKVSYRPTDRRAVIAWNNTDEHFPWLSPLRRMYLDHSDDVVQEGSSSITLPWWTFLSARGAFNEIIGGFRLKRDVDYEVEVGAQELLRASRRNEISYEDAQKTEPVS